MLGRVRRGVVGDSRYARRLRNGIHDAAQNPQRQPVLISGEPGLGKDNLAALIHYGSCERKQLLLRFEAGDLQRQGDALLHDLGTSSVLIHRIDQVEPTLKKQLIAMARGEVDDFSGRMLFTSETTQADLDFTLRIRVPPLRVRRSDLGD